MSSETASRLDGIARVSTPWRGGGEALRRDMELIRELLFEIEGGGGVRDVSGWDDATLRHHLRLLVEAGLLHGATPADGTVTFTTLSWAGHEFLDAVRQDAIWRELRQRLAQAGGGLAFETLKSLALSLLP